MSDKVRDFLPTFLVRFQYFLRRFSQPSRGLSHPYHGWGWYIKIGIYKPFFPNQTNGKKLFHKCKNSVVNSLVGDNESVVIWPYEQIRQWESSQGIYKKKKMLQNNELYFLFKYYGCNLLFILDSCKKDLISCQMK